MANTKKKFIVSVCNVYAFDPATKKGIWAGYSNINSTFSLAMTATEVRGGDGNALLFKYMHDRVLTVNVLSATFSKEVMAMNVGEDVNSLTNLTVLTEECVDFALGVGTMTGTAVGDVSVFFEDGSCETATPVTKKITLTDLTYNGKATVAYNTVVATAVDTITISTLKAPKVVNLYLIGNIKDSDGIIVEKININVPSFQVDGNYELAFASDGVAQQALTGTALSVAGTTCAEGDGYAFVRFIPVVPVV